MSGDKVAEGQRLTLHDASNASLSRLLGRRGAKAAAAPPASARSAALLPAAARLAAVPACGASAAHRDDEERADKPTVAAPVDTAAAPPARAPGTSAQTWQLTEDAQLPPSDDECGGGWAAEDVGATAFTGEDDEFDWEGNEEAGADASGSDVRSSPRACAHDVQRRSVYQRMPATGLSRQPGNHAGCLRGRSLHPSSIPRLRPAC
jgi:hypothetical protein